MNEVTNKMPRVEGLISSWTFVLFWFFFFGIIGVVIAKWFSWSAWWVYMILFFVFIGAFSSTIRYFAYKDEDIPVQTTPTATTTTTASAGVTVIESPAKTEAKFCESCGVKIDEPSQFCKNCGAPTT